MKKELKFNHEEFKHSSEDAKNLIRRFLKKDPDQRITLNEALNDPWLKDAMTSDIKVDIQSHKQIISKINN